MRRHAERGVLAVVLAAVGLFTACLPRAGDGMAVAGSFVLNDDGAWSWFEDERAVIQRGKLLVGSVANGSRDPRRRGNIEVVSYDLTTGEAVRSTLHGNLQADDHNSPALFARSDGRVLSMYSKHSTENCIYYRITTQPHDATEWQPEQVFVPSPLSRVTYSNLHWLSAENGGRGRLYSFFRGYEDSFKPSWMFSNNEGATWEAGGILIDFPSTFTHRPYVKYASDGHSTVHFLFTEGHPRDSDNSIYHAYYQAGRVYRSDGQFIQNLIDGPIQPEQAMRIFIGDPNNVAWTQDLHLDDQGHPYAAYSVQKDSAGLPRGQGGQDHRYRYARWDGRRWHDFEIAYGGSRLYAGEDDYTGGICLHPDDPNTVFISTNVNPVSGMVLRSRHYEIFQGITADSGRTWRWSPVTENSSVDNLRPVVPKWGRGKTVLLWLRGNYTSYTSYNLHIVGRILPGSWK